MIEKKTLFSTGAVSALYWTKLKQWGWPFLGIGVFLIFWHIAALQITTPLGTLPGPYQTAQQWGMLIEEHHQESENEAAFLLRQEQRNAEKLVKDPNADVRIRAYTGYPTFIDQTLTSLGTVISGFLLATFFAIPLGILLGMYPKLYLAFNPIIQLLKPISPLAWLPIITIVVSAVYVTPDPQIPKSFLNSMLTVMLCSMWPTLINTAIGVGTVDKDLLNVSRVLRLSRFKHIRTIVFPSAIPMMFAGLRLSLGVAWMVLIAAEMLAQNPGLGKFVWDEFQSGSQASIERIMVAVVVIGLIGLLLDRSMLWLQRRLSWDKQQVLR